MEEIKKISKEDFCEKFKVILPDHAPSDTQKGVIGNLGQGCNFVKTQCQIVDPSEVMVTRSPHRKVHLTDFHTIDRRPVSYQW